MNKLKVLQCLKVMNNEYRRIAQTPKNDPETIKFILAYDELYHEIVTDVTPKIDVTDVIARVVLAVVNRRDCNN